MKDAQRQDEHPESRSMVVNTKSLQGGVTARPISQSPGGAAATSGSDKRDKTCWLNEI
jgi:hypothetical protein